VGISFGSKYSHLRHGFGCLCHSPMVAEINARLAGGTSRQSALRRLDCLPLLRRESRCF
jgi:hypothetical protein